MRLRAELLFCRTLGCGSIFARWTWKWCERLTDRKSLSFYRESARD